MIWDVDEMLTSLLRAEALPGTDTDVVFDAPTREWATRLNGPVIDAFLYDIHEDVERRNAQTTVERDVAGRITGRRPGARYFRLSYLVSAWTSRAEDEHRLLGQLLENLIRFDYVPEEHLKGRLAGAAVSLTTALPPREDRSVSELWGALGGEMKPSLDVIVLVPLVPAKTFVAGPPVQQRDLRVVRKES